MSDANHAAVRPAQPPVSNLLDRVDGELGSLAAILDELESRLAGVMAPEAMLAPSAAEPVGPPSGDFGSTVAHRLDDHGDRLRAQQDRVNVLIRRLEV